MTALALQHASSLWNRIQCQFQAGGPSGHPHTVWRDDMLGELRRGSILTEESFVAEFWPFVESEARRYGRIGGDREELTGEGGLALWESALQYRSGQHRTTFTAYVKNQVHRRVRRAYLAQRGYGSSLAVTPLHPETAEPFDDRLSVAEWIVDITHAIRLLNQADRQALTDAAAGISSSTNSRKRRQRARSRLKAAMSGQRRDGAS